MLQEARDFLNTANAPIFALDEQLRITEWNRKTVEISSFEANEVPRVNFSRRTPK